MAYKKYYADKLSFSQDQNYRNVRTWLKLGFVVL